MYICGKNIDKLKYFAACLFRQSLVESEISLSLSERGAGQMIRVDDEDPVGGEHVSRINTKCEI